MTLKVNNNICVAVDVGTTTIGISCVDYDKKSVICEFSFSNPQKVYGADVITRIKRCIDSDTVFKSMSDILLMKLNEELRDALSDDYDRITCLCYSGNTTMLHILRKLSLEGLSASPFRPVTLDYFERNVTHNDNNNLNSDKIKEYFLPGFSAFVGADILAGAQYLGMGENDQFDLLVDLGTNGEMLLLNNKCGYATSTACGPVFDHGVTGAIYGSESIHAIAECIRRGLIDDTGLIKGIFFENGIVINNEVVIKQDQVRRFQMAKAAIYAGLSCLIDKASITYNDIDNVYISGGLGFFLDVKDAFITKLLPEQLNGKITVYGNTSLEGAKRFLLSYDRTVILQDYENIRSRTESFELADHKGFQDVYIDSMNF